MTLATHIYILGKIDGPDLFDWVNKNLLKVENPKVTRHSHGIHNVLGQGFDAIFGLDWYDEPHSLTDDLYGPDVDEEDVEYYNKRQEKIGAPYYATIYFDTTYGFNRDGMGCTELHASYIVRLYREYFEPRGIDIAWQDEYTGDIWRNLNEEGMTKFLGGGDSAMDWFQNIAKPAIEEIVNESIDWGIEPPSV